MRYLLDVNLLVAWGWADHAEHARAASWVAKTRKAPGAILLTSAIPELGFVRVSVQRTSGQVTPAAAGQVLAGMLRGLGSVHQFVPDDQTATSWPDWCCSAGQTTDAHLALLAQAQGGNLATLDKGIPGAFVIPAGISVD